MAQRGQILAQHFQGAHHAIDLRLPGIGDDQDLQMRRHAGNRPRLQARRPYAGISAGAASESAS